MQSSPIYGVATAGSQNFTPTRDPTAQMTRTGPNHCDAALPLYVSSTYLRVFLGWGLQTADCKALHMFVSIQEGAVGVVVLMVCQTICLVFKYGLCCLSIQYCHCIPTHGVSAYTVVCT